MNLEQIPSEWLNKCGEKHKRKIGRYNSSELYAIIKGYLNPADFFLEREKDHLTSGLMVSGIAVENMLTKMLTDLQADCKFQTKKEITINEEITLVAMPDFLFKTMILEVKCPHPKYVPEQIPEKWVYQLEAYYRAFYLPVYLGIITHPFQIKGLEYIPDKRRWNKIQEALLKFHQDVKKIHQ